MTIPFLKMHGLGNDFVVIDARSGNLSLNEAQARAIADRRLGVGCDQFIVIEPPRTSGATAFMRIRNPDGSESGACGNATRCVAHLLMTESGRTTTVVETIAGLLPASLEADGLVTVDMGPPRLDWRDIPLAGPADTLRLDDVVEGPYAGPTAVSMGNPHAVFFVDDVAAVPLERVGPRLEHHPAFPERANIEFAQVLTPTRIRMRVWERAAGITQACGSGACAVQVAAFRRGLVERRAEVVLDGGGLTIEWREDGHVLMTGPIALSFTGELSAELAGDMPSEPRLQAVPA
ncbi:diaminopimelate epimerase [Skermanella stibiiresistens SB22]|uniref:Diaminopimelate epimerase n=1 Tax=Skermanella stibiiresistens SB22 TaxID=1385369 RepID=W9H2F2_9PROT|nr:diaminopimelate epimerase [Skermanella stibiiresistens]EWY40365.1 diaminopimelate epimerase [Skermanella stibiiresistens SB22]